MRIKLRDRLLNSYKKLEQLQGDKTFIARGFAIGIFISMTPTIPFNTILTIILGTLLRGSIPAAFIGTLVSNPITIPFLYYAAYIIGISLAGIKGFEFQDILTIVYHFNGPGSFIDKLQESLLIIQGKTPVLLATLFGGIIMGIPIAIGSYYLILRLLRSPDANTRKDENNDLTSKSS